MLARRPQNVISDNPTAAVPKHIIMYAVRYRTENRIYLYTYIYKYVLFNKIITRLNGRHA